MMITTPIPLQNGFTVINKAVDIVDDATAVPRCTVQHFNPAWLEHRSMQWRPEGEGNFVDALPQTLCGCKSKIHH